MCGRDFPKLCGFQGIHTNVMRDRRGEKETPWEWSLWGGVTQRGGRRGVGRNVQENLRQQTEHKWLQLSGHYRPRHQKCLRRTSTSTQTQMDNPRNADSNCSLCGFGAERESEEWHIEEFQISKAIFHFPPSEGIQALTVLWKHQNIWDSFIN